MKPTADPQATDPHQTTRSQAPPGMEELLDLEFEEFCAREAAEDVSLDQVLNATAGIPGGMAQSIIEDERADRI